MVAGLLLTALACITLTALLWLGERTGDARARWIFKPATSALFLAVALAQRPADAYGAWILAGLALCAVGDVALISRGRRAFLAGLVAFLFGHVAYIAAFGVRADIRSVPPATLAVIVGLGLAVFLYLRPHLGSMFVPVVIYMLVISLMLAAAWAVPAAGDSAAGWHLALAATLFYVSDLTVARDRFVTGPRFGNRLVGLPLYYAAQFLLAFSIGR